MISRSEAVAFSMGDLREAFDVCAFSMEDSGEVSVVLAFLEGDLVEALAFLKFSLAEICVESRFAPSTFSEFCPSAACREIKLGFNPVWAESTESFGFVGMFSLPSVMCFLKLRVEAVFLRAISVEELGGTSFVTFLTGES